MSKNTNERPPKDLSVPETMKIAALLAELMPPGAMGGKSGSVALSSSSSDSLDDPAGLNLGAPALQIEDLDDLEPIVPPAPPSIPVASAAAIPGLFPASVPEPAETPQLPAIPRITTTVVRRHHGLEAPAKADISFPSNLPPKPPPVAPEPDVQAPAPVETARVEAPAAAEFVAGAALDPDLIPLGDLATASFFSLVNWRNDPERARVPRRADYGLDEQTLAAARRNPFYVIGQPRRPENRSVAEVLAEIAWE